MAVRRSAAFFALLVLPLSACIPRGGADYRIRTNAEPVSAEYDATAAPRISEAPRDPVLVPEKEIVAETPSWSPAKVSRNATRVIATTYTVRNGDSLFAIANRTGAGATTIADENALTPPYALRPGMSLNIPGGVFHRVGEGETGIAIARAYGINWPEVVALNRLPPPYTLQVGQNLRLPDAALPDFSGGDAISPEARAASFTLDIDSIVTGSMPAQIRSAAVTSALPRPAFTGAFSWPLSGSLISRFGSQGGGRVNDGIKIAAAANTAVGAAGDGTVVYAGNEISVLGGLVLIDHGGGWVTAYGHLASLEVARGDRVKQGQRLGAVGTTGYVDNPQLHFEIRKDRRPIDPLSKLPPR